MFAHHLTHSPSKFNILIFILTSTPSQGFKTNMKQTNCRKISH